MAFRFDMQRKTSQQQIIVAKKDAENKLREQAAAKNNISDYVSTSIMLVIDKDTCPSQDNIIMKQQCSGCRYYKEFEVVEGQPCVRCSFK